jgi:hypothetical protein
MSDEIEDGELNSDVESLADEERVGRDEAEPKLDGELDDSDAKDSNPYDEEDVSKIYYLSKLMNCNNASSGIYTFKIAVLKCDRELC